jgi:serine/threonine protein kinase
VLKWITNAAAIGGHNCSDNGSGNGKKHIIGLYDAFDLQLAAKDSSLLTCRCLVLELASGNLDDILTLDPPWSFGDRLKIFVQCVRAVEYVHSVGLCHGGELGVCLAPHPPHHPTPSSL